MDVLNYYDEAGRLRMMLCAGERTFYNEDGTVARIESGDQWTSFEYVRDVGANLVVTRTYSDGRRQVEVTGLDGSRLLTSYRADGSWTKCLSDPAGRELEYAESAGLKQTYSYQDSGQGYTKFCEQTEKTLLGGIKTTHYEWEYDAAGRLVEFRDTDGRWAKHEYAEGGVAVRSQHGYDAAHHAGPLLGVQVSWQEFRKNAQGVIAAVSEKFRQVEDKLLGEVSDMDEVRNAIGNIIDAKGRGFPGSGIVEILDGAGNHPEAAIAAAHHAAGKPEVVAHLLQKSRHVPEVMVALVEGGRLDNETIAEYCFAHESRAVRESAIRYAADRYKTDSSDESVELFIAAAENVKDAYLIPVLVREANDHRILTFLYQKAPKMNAAQMAAFVRNPNTTDTILRDIEKNLSGTFLLPWGARQSVAREASEMLSHREYMGSRADTVQDEHELFALYRP